MSLELTPDKIDELYMIYINHPLELPLSVRSNISKMYHDLHKNDEIKGI